jgi:hypothetical protein
MDRWVSDEVEDGYDAPTEVERERERDEVEDGYDAATRLCEVEHGGRARLRCGDTAVYGLSEHHTGLSAPAAREARCMRCGSYGVWGMAGRVYGVWQVGCMGCGR